MRDDGTLDQDGGREGGKKCWDSGKKMVMKVWTGLLIDRYEYRKTKFSLG